MNQSDVISKLTTVFRSVFDDDTISLTRASTAADIEEWDSLNQIKIILAAEQAFGMKLNARKINSFANVGDMVDYLVEEVANRPGASA